MKEQLPVGLFGPDWFEVEPDELVDIGNAGKETIKYTRSDLIDQGIKDALKERWTGVRNKIVDKLQDQITDDQLQVVLQIIDDEQWFPAIAEAIRNGEAEEVEK